ncbi:hypothetical protein [Caulobacter sp. NIBR2454]|uniref:hypothetical protein n=1 Tax=Caulobacter sp. NIBR2454 TaxID=3015996 RepID=UPI0022B62BC8|nr:hypothetical protein [Caulobacter sp. NIBR2454]
MTTTAGQPEALLAACRQRLANYKIPKRLHVLDALPLLPIGKVDKQALKQWVIETEGVQ